MPHTKTRLSLALLLILSLAGCSMSSVITDTQIVVDAISVAAPIIAAFAGPGAVLVIRYLTTLANGLNCVLSAAEAPGATTATTATAITTCLASAIEPVLPPGTPQNIVEIISVIESKIAALISKYGTRTLAKGDGIPMNLTYGDHRALKHMRSTLDAAIATLVTATH